MKVTFENEPNYELIKKALIEFLKTLQRFQSSLNTGRVKATKREKAKSFGWNYWIKYMA